jgi:hypothetical protein
MEVVRAHLRSDNDETVMVIVFDVKSGAIIQQKELDTLPFNETAMPRAREFLSTNYPKFEITSELQENINIDELLENLDEELEESQSDTTVTTPQGDIKTGSDGKPVVKGKTIVKLEPVPKREKSLFSGELEDQDDVMVISSEEMGITPEATIVKQKQPAMTALPDFPDNTVGMSRQELDALLNDYGTRLRQGSRIAGSDFELPPGVDGPPENINVAEIEEEIVSGERDEGGTTNELASAPGVAPTAPQPNPKRKRAVQTAGISPEQRAEITNDTRNRFRGVGGDHIVEAVPGFISTKTEKVISNRYNSWIVLGRDRADPEKASRASGYGGKGNTQCAAIDMVVGRMGPRPKSVDSTGERMEVDPIFNISRDEDKQPICDAARIYISQKTDVDKNFILAKGKVGMATARSAIAMKADGIRIMAREGIKLITRADKMNSQGGPLNKIFGVDIIAGNDDKSLQPMVLGNNLVQSMEEQTQILSEVIGTVNDLVINLGRVDRALSMHVHNSPFFGAPTMPDPVLAVETVTSLIQLASVTAFSNVAQKFNIVSWRKKYMRPGAKFRIRSKYNNVN